MEYFTEAKTVAEGERPSSYKHNALAHAVNSRMRSCLGDGPWRVAWHVYSLFRRLCYSDDFTVQGQNNLFPWDAFFRWFQALPAGVDAPTTAPGTVGGLALDDAQPMANFVQGNAGTLLPEVDRLDGCPAARDTDSPGAKWSAFKTQRGFAVDGQPLDVTKSPALEAGAWINAIGNIDRDITHADSGYGAWPDTTGVPALQKTRGETLPRSANAFVREFRGSDAQRNADGYHVQNCAAFNQAMASQLFTAPQYAPGGGVAPEYQTWEVLGTDLPAGTVVPRITGPADTPSGYVSTHWFASASGLLEPCVIRVNHSGGSFETTLDSDTGAILPLVEQSLSGVNLELPAGAKLQAPGGSIRVEITALLEMKPAVQDLYVIARLGGVKSEVPDGRGTKETFSKELMDDYLALGGIVNRHGETVLPDNSGYANRNAVYEAAKEMSKFVRVIPGFSWTNRNNFLAMERVFENGEYRHSVWMLRNDPDEPNAGDVFAGVAPIVAAAPEAGYSNEWICGVQIKPYTNSDSSVYKPEGFPSLMTFFDRATFGLRLNTPGNPDVLAFYKHLCASAGAIGELAARPENPTLFRYAPKRRDGSTQSGYFNGEAATDAGGERFLKSCRVYEPDLEIDHIEEFAAEPLSLVDEADVGIADEAGVNLITEDAPAQVRIDFKSRWHSTAGEQNGAPDTYSWDHHYHYEDYWAALRIENDTVYRTAENSLRSFLFYAWSVDNPVNGQQLTQEPAVGDGAYGNEIYQSGGGPNRGCTMPHFYFVKLMPLVRADGNTDQNPGTDTPFLHDTMLQADLYLRAMCEGFLRGLGGDPCDDVPALAEYTYGQLVTDADDTGALTSMPSIPDAATSRITSRWVRDDPPWGGGPLPNTYADARRFNLFVRAVNLLRRVRLPWPIDVEFEHAIFKTAEGAMADVSGSRGESCASGDMPVVVLDNVPSPDVDWNNPVLDWGPTSPWIVDASNETLMEGSRCWAESPKSAEYGVYSQINAIRWKITNQTAFMDALPPAVKSMVAANQTGLAARVEKVLGWWTWDWTTVAGDVTPDWEYGGGTGYELTKNHPATPGNELLETYETGCSVITTAVYAPPAPPGPSGGGPSGIGRYKFDATQDGCLGPTNWFKIHVAQNQSLILEPGILDPLPE